MNSLYNQSLFTSANLALRLLLIALASAKHTALEPIARPHVLRIVEIRPSGPVVMEGSDAARREEQIKNIVHCPLPILDTNMYPERYFRGPSLHYFVCGTRHRSAKMVICDKCNGGCHIWCLDVPLMRVPDEPWTCSRYLGTNPPPTLSRCMEIFSFGALSTHRAWRMPIAVHYFVMQICIFKPPLGEIYIHRSRWL